MRPSYSCRAMPPHSPTLALRSHGPAAGSAACRRVRVGCHLRKLCLRRESGRPPSCKTCAHLVHCTSASDAVGARVERGPVSGWITRSGAYVCDARRSHGSERCGYTLKMPRCRFRHRGRGGSGMMWIRGPDPARGQRSQVPITPGPWEWSRTRAAAPRDTRWRRSDRVGLAAGAWPAAGGREPQAGW